jgi:hypothetical protein
VTRRAVGTTDAEPRSEEAMVGDGAQPTPWAEARERLERAEKYRTYWLTTIRPDGRPHVMPVIGVWMDATFYFISGEGTQKGRNLEHNADCVMAVGSRALPAYDLVVEGTAKRVRDTATLERVAQTYTSDLHWPLEVREGAVYGPNAPTAGPPPYAVFALTPTTVFGLPGLFGMGKPGKRRKAPVSPTRWRF